MKKLKKFVCISIAIICIFMISGCAQLVMELQINPDGTGVYTLKQGFTDEYLIGYGVDPADSESVFASDIEYYEQQNFEVEMYQDDKYKGIVMSKTLDKIEPSELEYLGELIENMTVNTDGIVTDISGNFNLSKIEQQLGQSLVTADPEQTKDIDVRFIVKLPQPVQSTNATKVSDDKKTIEWDFIKFNGKIEAHSEASASPWHIVLLAAAVLIVVGLIVLAIVSPKLEKKTDNEEVSADENEAHGDDAGANLSGLDENPTQTEVAEEEEKEVVILAAEETADDEISDVLDDTQNKTEDAENNQE